MTREMRAHFNLTENPFSREIPTDQLLALPSIQTSLQTLKLLLETRGTGVLTGKSGTGKSCLIRMLINGMHAGLMKPLYLCHTSIGVTEFYTHLTTALGLPPAGRRATMFRTVQERIYSLHRSSHIHTVLIVDEAHMLSNEILKELRLIANFEVDSLNAMTILLCGQESLLQKFGLSILESLANSITISISTEGLPKEETFSYVEQRISACGGSSALFTKGALNLIHQASVGVLRSTGTIANAAMGKAFAGNSPTVETEHVQAVISR